MARKLHRVVEVGTFSPDEDYADTGNMPPWDPIELHPGCRQITWWVRPYDGSNDQSIILALRTANEASTCVVYSLDAGVADTSKIYVTGSVFGDGVLTRAIHIGLWGYKADVGSGHYCSDLNLWTPAP